VGEKIPTEVLKQRCRRGHAYDEVNTYWYQEKKNGAWRYRCRQCHRERQHRREILQRGYA
jgi:hypothetical protein